MKKYIFVFLLIIIRACICAEPTKQQNCPSIQYCDPLGYPRPVMIHFPFRLKSQPQVCGYDQQGFELSCQGSDTIINLPYSAEEPFWVNDIDYQAQRLTVSYPGDCIARSSFREPNISTSPFRRITDNDEPAENYYMIVNCSSNISTTIPLQHPVSCGRDRPGHFYAVPSDLGLGQWPSASCTPAPSYLYLPGFDLEWDLPDCRDCWNGLCSRSNGTSNSTTECVPPPPTPQGSNAKKVIIGLCSVACMAMAVAIILLVVQRFKAKNRKEQEVKIERFLEEYKAQKPTRYSYSQIKRMTDNFKGKLGQGGFGSVFKGKLPNGVPIAVKVLEDPTVNGEEFVNEVGTIGMIHHVNVVRLFGYCVEGSKRALIYEFMPNESLEKFIFAQDDRSTVLSWPKLQEIAMGIARGMEYLHQGCDRRILHFDIKPHNILLDHKFTPKISDFGLAKLCSKEMSIVSMTAVRGTVGYIAPEVYLRNSNMVSHKSDVYSFGMLLLEMVGGRRNDDDGATAAQIYFPEWIYLRLAGGEGLGLRTEGEEDVEIAKRLTATSLWCIQWNPVDRPSMGVAVQMLEGGAESFSLPLNPFTS